MSNYIMIDDTLTYWPRCKINKCENRRCDRLSSDYCYPHSLGLPVDFIEKFNSIKEAYSNEQ